MNLTIGQYYPTKSIIHDLDSRTKILATILYIVAIFVAKGIVGYGICTLFLGYAIFKSNVPFKMLLRGLKSIIIIIIFTGRKTFGNRLKCSSNFIVDVQIKGQRFESAY